MYLRLMTRTTRRATTGTASLKKIRQRILLFYRTSQGQLGLSTGTHTTRLLTTLNVTTRRTNLVTRTGLTRISTGIRHQKRILSRLTGVSTLLNHGMRRNLLTTGRMLSTRQLRLRIRFLSRTARVSRNLITLSNRIINGLRISIAHRTRRKLRQLTSLILQRLGKVNHSRTSLNSALNKTGYMVNLRSVRVLQIRPRITQNMNGLGKCSWQRFDTFLVSGDVASVTD